MYTAKWPPFLFWSLIVFSAPLSSDAQSTCAFMKETPLDLDSMPAEPRPAQNLTHCRPLNGHTCCTAQIELEMENYARLAVDRFVHDHLVLLRQFFDEFANNFQSEFRSALRSTQKQLDRMFEKTYGPFYIKNAKIFSDLFDELDELFASEQVSAGVRGAVASLFRKIFVTEFALMNPLRSVGDTERYCLSRIQTQLRPFGNLPAKIANQLDRTFTLWKQIAQSLERASILLLNVADRLTASRECTSALVRARQCQVCSGASSQARPCLGFCLNVLRGCFAEVAELEPQWAAFIDSLQQLSVRMRSASNPYSVMAPLPVQISEAIMLFQERGQSVSNRIIFQCFEPLFRLKRSAVESVGIAKDGIYSDRPVVVDAESNNSLAEFFEREYKKVELVRRSVALFTDRLGRMKGAWRLLPTAICVDGMLAASVGEQCWNGQQIAFYKQVIVASGVQAQRRNPEFRALNVSRETFIEERIKFASLARELNELYDGRHTSLTHQEPVEGSALEDLQNPDDEDSIEGSSYNRDDMEPDYRDPEDLVNIHLLEQRRERSLSDRVHVCFPLFLLLRFLSIFGQ